MVIEVVEPARIETEPKAMAIVGGSTTSIFAVAVFPLPASDEVTGEVVSDCVPAEMPVSLTLKVQDPKPARLASLRLIEVDPAVAMMVPPPQVPDNPLGVETARPLGRESVKPTPVRLVVGFGFIMLKASVVMPLRGTVDPLNQALIRGGDVTSGDTRGTWDVMSLIEPSAIETCVGGAGAVVGLS
jgi:hypothetical protein